MSIEAKCLAKLIPHRGNGARSCNDCDGKPSKENVCCHFTPWNAEEKESSEKQDKLTMALTVLARVNMLLGEIIRDNLIEDTSIASELADDVWEVLHGDRWEKNAMECNQQNMREVLEEAKRFIWDVQGFLHGMETTFPGETEIIQKINAVLSSTPRQCNVGTAEEQLDRFNAFCCVQKSCKLCPCNQILDSGEVRCNCFAWGQMPYEPSKSKGE